jgi:hypothetical protein
MGPVAEVGVTRCLAHKDVGIRIEGCRILHEIGTAKVLPALQIVTRDQNRAVALAAAQAIEAIKKRQ